MPTNSERQAPSLSVDEGTLHINGCLCVNTVAATRAEGSAMFEDLADPVKIDLSGVEVNGTAVMALLIAWQRELGSSERPVEYIGASKELLAIAEACGLLEILAFS